MVVARAAKEWLLLTGQHWKATLPAFLAAALLYLGAAAVWPKQYAGFALVELNPEFDWKPDQASQSATAAAAVRQATTPADWAAIVTRLRLFPETVSDGRLDSAASYLASQVSIQEAEDAKHVGPVIRVDYANSDRAIALGVTQAVADNLTRPISLLAIDALAKPASAAPAPLVQSAPALPGAPTIAPPAAPPSAPLARSKAARREAHAHRGGSRRPKQNTARDADGSGRLQARLAEGRTLQNAFNENAQALNGLRQQLVEAAKKAAAPEPAAKAAAPGRAAAPPADPEIEHLRGELARAEQALAGLEQRYTNDYPDVVAARERVRDLSLEIDRARAAASAKSQPEMPAAKPVAASAPPMSQAARSELVRRIGESQAAEERLRADIETNRAEVARLRSEAAMSKSALAQNGPAQSGPAASGGEAAETAAAGPSTAPSAPLPAAPLPAAPLPAAPLPAAPLPAAPPEFPPAALAGASPAPETGPAVIPSSIPVATPMSLAESATVSTSPAIFAGWIAWCLSLACGCGAAFAAVWLAERRDPSIRGERMLRHELPPSAIFLGRIPRVRHETVPR